MVLSNTEIIEVAEHAAERAVTRTLLTLGIDVNDPLNAQRDFAIMREVGELARDPEFRKDIEHTRKWRKTLEAIQTKGFLTAVGLIVTAIFAVALAGLKSIFIK